MLSSPASSITLLSVISSPRAATNTLRLKYSVGRSLKSGCSALPENSQCCSTRPGARARRHLRQLVGAAHALSRDRQPLATGFERGAVSAAEIPREREAALHPRRRPR